MADLYIAKTPLVDKSLFNKIIIKCSLKTLILNALRTVFAVSISTFNRIESA